MSTYYYLACDKCKEQVPFWTVSAGQSSVIPTAEKCPYTVTDFLESHCQHGVVVFSEHDERHEEYVDALDHYPKLD